MQSARSLATRGRVRWWRRTWRTAETFPSTSTFINVDLPALVGPIKHTVSERERSGLSTALSVSVVAESSACRITLVPCTCSTRWLPSLTTLPLASATTPGARVQRRRTTRLLSEHHLLMALRGEQATLLTPQLPSDPGQSGHRKQRKGLSRHPSKARIGGFQPPPIPMLYTSIALAIASIYHSQQRQRRMRLQLERILRRMAHRTRLAAITMNVLATQESHDRKSPREKPRSRGN